MNTTLLLHHAFEQRALSFATSSNIALRHKEKRLTYQELNHQANQLAHHLVACGVSTGSIVGIYFLPSVEQIISLLAILKVGAVYLPLDPNYPKERLEFMAQNSQACLILSHSSLPGYLQTTVETLFLDTLTSSLANYPTEAPAVSYTSENLCYIIYTSGTTGQPKGVMIEHGNAMNTVSQMNAIFSLEKTDNFLLNTSLSFDPSVWMLFWPLATGACVIISDTDKDPDYFIQLICQYHIRAFHAGPTLFRMMFRQSKMSQCSSLQLFIGGGEAWKPMDLMLMKQSLPLCELCNVYGPTEASIHITFWHSHSHRDSMHEIPIGKPIQNMQVLLLDENGKEIIAGDAGELYVTGKGVARGYLNNETLTKEKFVVLNTASGSKRYYRTGDLVKQLPDGNLVFLGRIDSQIKLRGVRIEPAEIENQILDFGFFNDALVLGYRENNVVTQLVAFVLLKDPSQKMDANRLNAHLKKTLPAIMIPSCTFFLETFPRTVQGKIDTDALFSLFNNRPIQSELLSNETNTDPVYKALVGLWMRVLKLDAIPIDAHFFDLGGDSLIALDLIAEINQYFQVALSVTCLFEFPTIIAFSGHLQSLERKNDTPVASKTSVSLADNMTFPLSDNQLWLIRIAKSSLSVNNIVTVLQLPMRIQPELMKRVVLQLLQQIPLLRVGIFKQNNTYCMKLLSHDISEVYGYFDIAQLPSGKQESFIQEHYEVLNSQQVHLERDPLFKVTLVNCSANCAILYIYTHHVITDPTSGLILINRLVSFYQQALQERPEGENENPISFFEYAACEIETRALPAYQENVISVCETIAARNWCLNLGKMEDTDRAGGFFEYALPQTTSEEIKHAANLYRVTPFVFLLSAFKLALFQLHRQKQFGIGLNISQRYNAKWSKMIGPLSEQALSCIDFSRVSSFADVLKVTTENMNHIYNQPASIERILQRLQQTQPAITDIFNVLFDYEKRFEEHQVNSLAVKIYPVKSLMEVRRHLTVRVVEDEGGHRVQVRYRKNLFQQPAIQALVIEILAVIKNATTTTSTS